jgi:CopG family nickel-responsive transcriptional regulator
MRVARVLSLSVDEETERSIHVLERTFNFRNRSETLRASVRALAAELEDLGRLRGLTTAVAVAVHDDSRDAELAELKHEFDDIVATQVHNYLSGECVEVFVLNGPAERIGAFAKTLKSRPHLAYSRVVTPSAAGKR